MDVRIIDLDGGVTRQPEARARAGGAIFPATAWGPFIRLACSFGRFRRFERALGSWLGGQEDRRPFVTFYGSGDFHHVSLALVRRVSQPINLVVLDNHPDWMRGVPFLHCGTWLYHAARLGHVQRIFHLGGDVDFDNYYQAMAPWKLLRSGKITVIPAIRRFRRGAWSELGAEPLRPEPDVPASAAGIEEILAPVRGELARRPLYVSLDKDVMVARDALVNWDSGHLTLAEVQAVLETCLRLADGRLAGMDVVGDWSPVRVQGGLRRLMHLTMHPALELTPEEAARRNDATNRALLGCLMKCEMQEIEASRGR
jgi:hypothetical protein